MPKKPRNPNRDISWGSGSVLPRGNRWEARWYDEGGVRRGRTFATKDEGDDFLRTLRRKRERGQYIAPADLTVADLVEEWLETGPALNDWKPSTTHQFREHARNHVLPALGHIRADQLDAATVQRWVNRLTAEGYRPRSITAYVHVLSAPYTEAVRLGIVPVNPCAAVRRPSIRSSELVTWNAEHAGRVDRALADEPLWRALYRVAMTTGMRPGELQALQWGDLSFEALTITVRRTLTQDASGRTIVGDSTKTGQTRIIPLSPTAAALLSELPRRSLFVFPITRRAWSRRHAALIADLRLPPITLHGLRHTFATNALDHHIPAKLVADILGHRTIQTTLNIYTHPTTAMQRQASNALEQAIFGATRPEAEESTG